MRLLANENFPEEAVIALRLAGHDVVWVRTEAPGISDEEVLAWAQREQRILITFDKDFGDLAFHARLPATCGIILFRIAAPSAGRVGRAAVATLNRLNDWAGYFSVVEEHQTRSRPLPHPRIPQE